MASSKSMAAAVGLFVSVVLHPFPIVGSVASAAGPLPSLIVSQSAPPLKGAPETEDSLSDPPVTLRSSTFAPANGPRTAELTQWITVGIWVILFVYLLYVCGSIVRLLRQVRDELIGLRADREREKIKRY